MTPATPRRPALPRATRRALPLLTAAVVLSAAACTDGAQRLEVGDGATAPPSAQGAVVPRPAAPSSASPTPTPTPTPSPAAPVTLALAGDVHFAGRLEPLLDEPATSLASLRPYLATADLAVVNLETAITTRGTEQPKKFHFRAPPTALDALAAAGVDAVSLANNHAVDYGEVGLRDTLAAQDASPIPVVGIGSDAAEAYAPAYLEARGTRVALLAATQVPDWTRATWPARVGRAGVAVSSNPERLVAAVKAAGRQADVVVVYLHWGTDYTECPDAAQQDTASALAAAGADVIVGTHAHRIQGSGWSGDTFVAYGLGNFVWWRANEPDARTGVLTVTIEGGRVVSQAWTPMLIRPDGVPREPDAADRERLLGVWEQARRCTGLKVRPATP